MTQAEYEALAARSGGFSSGVAKSEQLNKVWRQSSFVASVLADFIAKQSGNNVLDDGNVAVLLANLELAIKTYAGSNLPEASLTQKGIVQLSSSITSTSEVLAATPKAVKAANDAALQKSANLSDLQSTSTARTNLGLGGAAVLNVGTTVGTVAAGDDPRITASLLKANNLSDLTNVPAALSNLGLGDAAKKGIATNAEMQVGTADKLVSLVGLISIFGKRTFTANDYIRIPDVPGGFIVQFGTATTLASGDTIVTFPIPFPNKVLGIHPSQNNSYTNGAWAAYSSKSLSSFALSGWTNATTRIAISVDYFAVGY
ncbi:TPA: tail fiber protein [Yersinia enterocolitica]|nr:tail fiber protein [Yersinia enterocolitica]EKN4145569.1 tail fiber protein [Yersinia enterocolitica]HDL7334404.1 tail fiber protein [Yersinia enterocolitica]HDL8460070.1 tail fiber protein [Yersinia enterocolitica]HDM8358554.1 tail fiber protein [Yersinia enterocolitica]